VKPALLIGGLAVTIMLVVWLIYGIVNAPDWPTDATAPHKLEAQRLPANAPTLLAPAKPKTDVTELYLRSINFYLKHRADLSKQEPDPDMVTGLMALLVETGGGGYVRHGFLDEQIAWDLSATARFADAVDGLMYGGLSEANWRDRAGDRPGAAGAIWIWGVWDSSTINGSIPATQPSA